MDEFRRQVYDYYRLHARSFSWRQHITPYRVLVSEIMLQQTQTHRVGDKFAAFTHILPDFDALARAPFPIVLGLWKGLGYNRRAQYLQACATRIANDHAGQLPDDPAILKEFPGIGPATACSIVTFAYNKPTVFIETNIRAVFIHHFFRGQSEVSDKQLLPLVQQALDVDNPRQWYYALMDYGVMLKKEFSNPARVSTNYTKQSRFKGSLRQMRGMILHHFLTQHRLRLDELELLCNYDARVTPALDQLVRERFVCQDGDVYRLVG